MSISGLVMFDACAGGMVRLLSLRYIRRSSLRSSLPPLTSLLPPPTSIATLGLIGTGGTSKLLRSRFSGLPISGLSHRSSQSLSGMFLNISMTLVGKRSSFTKFLNFTSSDSKPARSLFMYLAFLRLSLRESLDVVKALFPVYGSCTAMSGEGEEGSDEWGWGV